MPQTNSAKKDRETLIGRLKDRGWVKGQWFHWNRVNGKPYNNIQIHITNVWFPIAGYKTKRKRNITDLLALPGDEFDKLFGGIKHE